jgi:serine/threonine protein kinase
MNVTCQACGAEALDIDVKCGQCGEPLTSTGAFRLVGSTVLGQYEIVDILGQGGMSVVYKGRHAMTDQEVALKILPPELAAHSQVKSRFLEEARALAQLDHPNIVHLYNFGQENGCFVLAMQFVDGKTFERLILEAGRLEWPLAVHVCVEVLRALEYAHERGIIHRDMKPSNILVREDTGAVTVMDFGIAKMTTSSKLTATGQTMGTVRYMSPEQVRGQAVDQRTDIYSLGVSLYEALVGDTPFDGETHFEIMTKHLSELPEPPSAHGIEVPALVEQVIMRSMAKKPDGRFASAREMRKALQEALRDADVGQAETLRMSRELLASRQRQPKPTAPMGPEAAAAAGPAPEVEHLEEPTDTLRRPGRSAPVLWIGLAAVVVVASVGVAVVLARSDEQRVPERSAAPAPAPDAPVAEQPRWPEPLRPAGVTLAVEATFDDDQVRVLAAGEVDPQALRDAHLAGRDRFSEILGLRGLREAPEVQPITILVVPREVLCSPAIWDVAEACDEFEYHYSPATRTLVVDQDSPRLPVNVAAGAAVAVCLHTRIPDCDRAAYAFYDELDRRGIGKE